MDAWLGGAADQLMGQIASAKIPLSRMISPQLYWVMSGDEFSLDINNPDDPKVLVVGNNPDRQNIYGAALGLYNSRIVKLINKKGQLKSSVVIDELPTIYFKGLDNLMWREKERGMDSLLDSVSCTGCICGAGTDANASPCLASSYKRTPFILIAEYIGGVCSYAPSKLLTTAKISACVTFTAC